MVVDNNKSVPSIMSCDVSQFSEFGSPVLDAAQLFVGEKLFDEQSHTHILGPIKLSTKRREKLLKEEGGS